MRWRGTAPCSNARFRLAGDAALACDLLTAGILRATLARQRPACSAEVQTLRRCFERVAPDAAFVAAFPPTISFGLNRGFDVYGDRIPRGPDAAAPTSGRASQVATKRVAWLRQPALPASPAHLPSFYGSTSSSRMRRTAILPAAAARPIGTTTRIATADSQIGRLLARWERHAATPLMWPRRPWRSLRRARRVCATASSSTTPLCSAAGDERSGIAAGSRVADAVTLPTSRRPPPGSRTSL